MPLVTEREIPGFVACRDPRCPGYTQRQGTVTERTQAFPYRELGGDLPGNEREAVDIVHPDDPCPECGGPQTFSVEPRPEYAPISGQDPLALINHLGQSGRIQDAQLSSAQNAKELAEMRLAMAELQAELQRRKGGRPPREPSEQ